MGWSFVAPFRTRADDVDACVAPVQEVTGASAARP